MSTLALVVLGEGHYAAVSDGHGSAVALPDLETGLELRPNAQLLDLEGCWAGHLAMEAMLAGFPGQPAGFDVTQLRSPDSICNLGGKQLHAPAVLALLARQAMHDAEARGLQCSRIVIACTGLGDTRELVGVESYVGDALGRGVRLRPIATAFERLLQWHGRSRASAVGDETALLGLLEGEAWFARVSGGSRRCGALDWPFTLRELRGRLSQTAPPASPAPAWSLQRLWSEFLRWYEAESGRTSGEAEAFLPHLIDRRVRGQLVEFAKVRVELADMLQPVLQALAPEVRGVNELLVMGDAALKLGVREAIARDDRYAGIRVTRVQAAELAVAMAMADDSDPRPQTLRHEIGLMVRPRPEAEKQFVSLIPAGEKLPARGVKVFAGASASQRLFGVDVAMQPPDGRVTRLRRLEFERRFEAWATPSLEVRLNVDAGGVLRVETFDSKTREALQLVSSACDGPTGPQTGPEEVAKLPLVRL